MITRWIERAFNLWSSICASLFIQERPSGTEHSSIHDSHKILCSRWKRSAVLKVFSPMEVTEFEVLTVLIITTHKRTPPNLFDGIGNGYWSLWSWLCWIFITPALCRWTPDEAGLSFWTRLHQSPWSSGSPQPIVSINALHLASTMKPNASMLPGSVIDFNAPQ